MSPNEIRKPLPEDFGITAADVAEHEHRFLRSFSLDTTADVHRAVRIYVSIVVAWCTVAWVWLASGSPAPLDHRSGLALLVGAALVATSLFALIGLVGLPLVLFRYISAVPTHGTIVRVRDYLMARANYENAGRPPLGTEKASRTARLAWWASQPPEMKAAVIRQLDEMARESLARAERDGDWRGVQAARARIAWLGLGPELRDEEPPPFDPAIRDHVAFARLIASDYGDVMQGIPSNQYATCLYRPESLLPYPKSLIQDALDFLLDIHQGRLSSTYYDARHGAPRVGNALAVARDCLHDYIDVPPGQLPTEPGANLQAGQSISNGRGEPV